MNFDEPVVLSDALTLAILGIIGVFIALIALMMVVKAIGGRKQKQKEPAAAEPIAAASPAAPAAAVPNAGKVAAPGSQGEIDLYNVDDHTAALLMAIVADDLKAELNTLRFISIREVG
ncbi:MAG: OadG family protein [Oscillospiraceae bacterium]|nr:OadG family protein [Oscillospiraceae bacterium]